MVRIPKGQTPLEESDNNVEVFPAQVLNINNHELTTHLSNLIDPLQGSSNFGMDIYAGALQIVVQKLGQLNL